MRAFVAVEIELQIRRAIFAAVARIRESGIKASWVKIDSMHLTLKFLGDIRAEQVPEVVDVLEQAASVSSPFTIQIADLGAFPSARRPRVMWTGVRDPAHALQVLARSIDLGLRPLGVDKGKGEFHPHITLARVRGRSGDLTERLDDPFEGGEQEVGAIVLFQSELEPSGAIHTPIARVALGGP
ncbi:MAG: RNA 2',3'-cyclic phosphodiesterase [Planctomycetota bacterium]|nr:RNA 2',3'-cyclic phosphodiesterase [Planctomycetota bacterium]